MGALQQVFFCTYNKKKVKVIVGTVGLQVAAVYTPFLQRALHTVPLGWRDWGGIALLALPLIVGPEIYKQLRARRAPG